MPQAKQPKKSLRFFNHDDRTQSAVDPQMLTVRVEQLLPPKFATRKSMFGGITFLHRGNMLCCASRKGLMVRVGADAEPTALKSQFASRCLGAGRPMAGFIIIEPAGLSTDESVSQWLDMARSYVETLPEKIGKRSTKPRKAKAPKSMGRFK